MLKQLRSKVSLILLLNLFLLSSVDLSSQSADASVINAGIIITTRPVSGKKNKYKSTVTMYAKATNVVDNETTTIEVRETATGKTPEASERKAKRKAKNNFFKQLFQFLGLKKKKSSGDQVMADPDGNGDYKGGMENGSWPMIIIFGSGGEGDPMPQKGDKGSETFVYNSVEEFNQSANAEIDKFMDGLTIEK